MGEKFEVSVWQVVTEGYYEYTSVYRGPSLISALWVAFQMKLGGFGCVKIEWR